MATANIDFVAFKPLCSLKARMLRVIVNLEDPLPSKLLFPGVCLKMLLQYIQRIVLRMTSNYKHFKMSQDLFECDTFPWLKNIFAWYSTDGGGHIFLSGQDFVMNREYNRKITLSPVCLQQSNLSLSLPRQKWLHCCHTWPGHPLKVIQMP